MGKVRCFEVGARVRPLDGQASTAATRWVVRPIISTYCYRCLSPPVALSMPRTSPSHHTNTHVPPPLTALNPRPARPAPPRPLPTHQQYKLAGGAFMGTLIPWMFSYAMSNDPGSRRLVGKLSPALGKFCSSSSRRFLLLLSFWLISRTVVQQTAVVMVRQTFFVRTLRENERLRENARLEFGCWFVGLLRPPPAPPSGTQSGAALRCFCTPVVLLSPPAATGSSSAPRAWSASIAAAQSEARRGRATTKFPDPEATANSAFHRGAPAGPPPSARVLYVRLPV